jgi:hypothetical protein
MKVQFFPKTALVTFGTAVALLAFPVFCSAQASGRSPDRDVPGIVVPPPSSSVPDRRPHRRHPKTIPALLSGVGQSVPDNEREPITVLPQNRKFASLQEAIAFCSEFQNQNRSKGKARALTTIVIPPGPPLEGNWTLAPDTVIVGDAGPAATILVGKPGVNEPVIKVATSGATEYNYSLIGLGIYAREVAGVLLSGNASSSELEIDNCMITVLGTAAIPALKVSGSGNATEALELDITESEIGSDYGLALDADVGEYTNIWARHTDFSGGLSAVDARSSVPGGSNRIEFFYCDLEGELGNFSLGTENLSVFLTDTFVWAAAGDAVRLIGTSATGNSAVLNRCNVWSLQGDGIEADGMDSVTLNYSEVKSYGASAYGLRALNSSTVSLYYTGFFYSLGIFEDSTSTIARLWSHWNGTPL